MTGRRKKQKVAAAVVVDDDDDVDDDVGAPNDDDDNKECLFRCARLWDVIVNLDAVTFEHILPKLNGTDVKFLYDANSQTRAMIKRAAAVGIIKLAGTFKVKEMSSTSTLEFVWENKASWPDDWEEEEDDDDEDFDDDDDDEDEEEEEKKSKEKYFCHRVAQTNKLELLKWAREEKKCEWDERVATIAAQFNNVEMLEYCMTNKCPYVDGEDENFGGVGSAPAEEGHIFYEAVAVGGFECLQYLDKVAKIEWSVLEATKRAAKEGRVEVLKYLFEKIMEDLNDDRKLLALNVAARNGQLECVKFLREVCKAPWNGKTVIAAIHGDVMNSNSGTNNTTNITTEEDIDSDDSDDEGENRQRLSMEILKYCVENKCPVDDSSCDREFETCREAAALGHRGAIRYLVHEKKRAKCDFRCLRAAFDKMRRLDRENKHRYQRGQPKVPYAKGNYISCMVYMVKHKCPGYADFVRHVENAAFPSEDKLHRKLFDVCD